MTTAQFKNSVLFYAVQTVEKMADIFVKDRALKECTLFWSDTSVYDVIYMHLECSCVW